MPRGRTRAILGGLVALLAACGGGTETTNGLDVVFAPDMSATDAPEASDPLDPDPVADTHGDSDTGNIVNPFDPGPAADASGEDGPGTPDAPVGDAGPHLVCNSRTKFVYLTTRERHLLRFDPATGAFTDISQGPLQCGATSGATPFAMSVDRQAVAWVLYLDGRLFKVSTVDGSCESTPFQAGQHYFDTFGMSFVSDAPGSEAETLFVSRIDGVTIDSTLGTIALPSLTLSVIQALEKGLGSADVTGNGLGELWGFFASSALVARIDKQTGALSNKLPLDAALFQNTDAWAFAYWGGNFYIFDKRDDQSSSSVYRLTPAGVLDTVVSDSGWTITGAGVSSCAPTGT